jgi:hypothetical protein
MTNSAIERQIERAIDGLCDAITMKKAYENTLYELLCRSAEIAMESAEICRGDILDVAFNDGNEKVVVVGPRSSSIYFSYNSMRRFADAVPQIAVHHFTKTGRPCKKRVVYGLSILEHSHKVGHMDVPE